MDNALREAEEARRKEKKAPRKEKRHHESYESYESGEELEREAGPDAAALPGVQLSSCSLAAGLGWLKSRLKTHAVKIGGTENQDAAYRRSPWTACSLLPLSSASLLAGV